MNHSMRGIILGTALAAAGSAPAHAGTGSLSLWGGYALPVFADANAANAAGASAAASAGSTDAKSVDVAALYGGGVAVGVELNGFAAAGVRAGYLVSNAGSLRFSEHDASRAPFMTVDTVVKEEASYAAIPLLVGGTFRTPYSEYLGLNAGVYAGLGLTRALQSIDDAVTRSNVLGSVASPLRGTVHASGAGFAGEASVGVSVKVSGASSLGLDVGYRVLTTGLTADADVDLDGDGKADIKKGDATRDSLGKTLRYDFSGPFANVSLTFHI